MKRLLSVLLCTLLITTLFACGSNNDEPVEDNNTNDTPITNNNEPVNNNQPDVNTPDVNVVDNTKTIEVTLDEIKDGFAVTISDMPTTAKEMEQFNLTNEYEAGMALMCVLYNFENNYDEALLMLDYIKGVEPHSAYDESFIKNQIDQYPYVTRSYFKGATVENDYTPEALTIEFTEGPYSRDEEGYVKLFVQSAGADSPRSFTLRKKGSTGEWFLFSDTYKGIMSGIRQPKSADPWA